MMLNRQLMQALQRAQPRDRPLVEFKAGRMTVQNDKLVPQRTKGKVVLVTVDQMVHLQWKDRENNDAIPSDMDIAIPPGTARFGRVKNVPKGRVFVLKFTTGERQEFFWMQEADENKDEEYMRKVNQHINEEQQQSDLSMQEQLMSRLFSGGAPRSQQQQQQQQQQSRHEVGLNHLQDVLRGLQTSQQDQQQQPSQESSTGEQQQDQQQEEQQQQQLSQEASAAASSSSMPHVTAPTPPTSETMARDGGVQQEQRGGTFTEDQQRNLFEQLQMLQNQYSQAQQPPTQGPYLQHVLSTDAVCQALRKHPEVATRLVEYLPEGTAHDVESICDHIRSPQFQSSIAVFNHALVTGEIQPFLESFGLPRATGGGLISFWQLENASISNSYCIGMGDGSAQVKARN